MAGRFQFSVKGALLTMVLVAVFCGAMAIGGRGSMGTQAAWALALVIILVAGGVYVGVRERRSK